MTKVSEYLKKKKADKKSIPTNEVEGFVEKLLKLRFILLSRKLEKDIKEEKEKLYKEVIGFILKDTRFKGETGELGKDGHTPTSEEILDLINPLIPQLKDGATPTREELLDLIIPLIPEVKDGEKGKDGTEIKPQDIAKKLNTLEEKVEMKVIKGLKDYLKKLETTLFYKGGKSGGGMGQPQHETFAVDSSTTSITTAYEIAADGRAIFGLRYQGQTLHWGEHYTVSGKVITLLFTPDDNSTADITYIRK